MEYPSASAPHGQLLVFGEALFCGFPIPLNGLGSVRWHAPAILIEGTEAVLGLCIPLRGSVTKPPECLAGILDNAVSLGIHEGEIVLGSHIASLGKTMTGRCNPSGIGQKQLL